MARPKFSYSKLKGRIIEKCGTQRAFAELLGISECTLTSKLQGHTFFSQPEIYRAIQILDIKPSEVTLYFFTI